MAMVNPLHRTRLFPAPALLNRYGNGAILGRHMKTANVIWCDGHAKATRLGTLGETHVSPDGKKTYMFRFSVEED